MCIGCQKGFIQVDFGLTEYSASGVVSCKSLSQLRSIAVLMVAVGDLHSRNNQLETRCRLAIGMQTGKRSLTARKVGDEAATRKRGTGLCISKICSIT